MAGAAVARRRALATYVIAVAVCFPAFWLVAVAANLLVAGSIPGSITDRRTFSAAGGAVV